MYKLLDIIQSNKYFGLQGYENDRICETASRLHYIDNKIYSPLTISGYIHNLVGAYY